VGTVTTARRMGWLVGGLVVGVIVFGGGWVVGRSGLWTQVERASLAPSEEAFVEQLSGSTLHGTFTIDGRDGPGRAERYDISRVSKVEEGLWRFDARVRYGSFDTTAPVTVPMRWVGDTPVITMTEYELPGIGTFSVRLFFHGDRYSGVWQHGKVGGHMFGRIEKTASPEP
jgi:hypothetical protein